MHQLDNRKQLYQASDNGLQLKSIVLATIYLTHIYK